MWSRGRKRVVFIKVLLLRDLFFFVGMLDEKGICELNSMRWELLEVRVGSLRVIFLVWVCV